MTEDEYKSLAKDNWAPVYDEDDPRCKAFERPPFGPVYEIAIYTDALLMLKDLAKRLKGGIRYWDGAHKESQIFAYFWDADAAAR